MTRSRSGVTSTRGSYDGSVPTPDDGLGGPDGPDQPGDSDEVLRQFAAMVAAPDVAGLRSLGSATGADPFARRTTNPHLRRARRATPVLLRVRVDLVGAAPPIWRRLALRSDLTLAAVHDVLQAAYGWAGGHLHRFAIGGDCFDPRAEWFLCPFDAVEGDDLGTPDSEVTLDEVLVEPGDVLHYVYDYGDEWDLVLVLEEVAPVGTTTPPAACLDGERAAPPEDCGGVRDVADLVGLLEDPNAFDTAGVDRLVAASTALLALRPDLAELLGRLRATPVGPELLARVAEVAGVTGPPSRGEVPDEAILLSHLAGHRWFLQRAQDGGLPLTPAGYLRPVDVAAAAAVLPSCSHWLGRANREDLTWPVRELRAELQRMRLLRKHQGRLVLTPAGRRAVADPSALWEHLRLHLVSGSVDAFEVQARLLALLYVASEPRGHHEHRLADALTWLGWRERGTHPISPDTAAWAISEVTSALTEVAVRDDDPSRAGRSSRRLSSVAVELARAALAPW
ncbi:hypothetical protein GCM10027270_24000 [Nocardioides ginkgobilobae]